MVSGQIDDLGSIDPNLGGESSRYSISAAYESSRGMLSAYVIDYDLSLVSNFTYFLDDPMLGDQFEQVDDRTVIGGSGQYRFDDLLFGRPLEHSVGFDVRFDAIDEVALYRTTGRAVRLGAVRSDEVHEFSLGVYWQGEIRLTDRLRGTLGSRYDYYDFDVEPLLTMNVNGIDLSANRGGRDADLLSLKGALAYAFGNHVEAYASAGQSMHSNDARGTVTRVDPGDGSETSPVDPLVRSWGAELGLRAHWADRLNASLSLWRLNLNSELLFIGDAGNTEASRASRRQGFELTAYYRFDERWSADLEYSRTDADFTEPDPADPMTGDYIPGSVRDVLQAGVSARYPNGWFAAVRLRYFGPRALVEDNSLRSRASTAVNLLAGYEWRRVTLQGELLNLFDSRSHDIDYYYQSRLQGEPAAGVEDLHYHVMEPRTIRLTLKLAF
jgi:outer membrane receptor for monomeric catechols